MFFFPAVLLATLVGSGVQGKSCSLNLQTDLDSAKEPLILGVSGKSLNFVWPSVEKGKGVLTVEDGSKLLLACPGSKNYQTTSGDKSAYATCKSGRLTVGGKAVDSSSTACSSSYADSSVMVTDTVCGSGDNTGVIVKLGFTLEDGSWFPLIDTCHNIDRSTTLYAAHQVYGASIKGGVKSSERRSFSRGPSPLFPSVNPESVYVRSGQKKAFNQILGNGGADEYISTSSFLSRGHLAPDADFIYNSGQLATYYHVNVAPQWQIFNAGNWLAVENAVRDLAAKVSTTLNVWTGTYSILTLQNKKMFLDAKDDVIPVPEVFWKVVQNPKTNECTVAIGTNNPFLTSAPTPICSTSSPSGWPSLTTLKKGYGYYCSYENFKSVVDYVPKINCAGGLFEFP